MLTGGEQSDYKQALNLLDRQDASFVLADKGYDADYILEEILAKGAQPVIPPGHITDNGFMRQTLTIAGTSFRHSPFRYVSYCTLLVICFSQGICVYLY